MAFVPWKDRVTSTPHRYKLTNVSGDTYDLTAVPGAIGEAGTPVNAANLNKLIQRDGDDIKDTVTTFTEASTRANIGTGESTATLFGKIKKWYTDLKPHAFNDLATALGTEEDKAPTNKLLKESSFAAIYSALNDSRLTGITTASTPSDVAAAMANNSLLEANTTGYANIVPTGITDTNGIITIHKVNRYRCYMFWAYQTSTIGRLFYATYRSDSGFKGWYEITSSKDISTVMPISSAAASNKKVLSEKVVYDEFAKRTYSWIYTSLASLGITTSSTMVDAATAMLNNGVATINVTSAYTNILPPNAYNGVALIKIERLTDYRILCTASMKETNTYNSQMWFGFIKLTDDYNKWSGWKQLATTDDISTVMPYDKVIRTQAEFNALIKSPTWLGAESVALVGQFTYSEANNSGIKIPATVKQIHGFNSAKITITDFVYDSDDAKGGLWYDTLPTTLDYSIRDLEVAVTATGALTTGYGFNNCTNLTNCTGTGTGIGTTGYGFNNCTNLTNCTGTGTGTVTGTTGYGFNNCTNLTNCTGTGTGNTDGYGFGYCTNLTNCTGTGVGTNGYGFYTITYASNCKDGGSSTNMWGGTNKNIDVDTCCMTPVPADNTELNT